MEIHEQIIAYITGQDDPKRSDLLMLHRIILDLMPSCKVWFLDGKNSENKIVANANIGYGNYQIKYVDGKYKDFYQIGLSANKTGISVYIMGVKDKTYLPKTFSDNIGKASVTGYCIKFKELKVINVDQLILAIKYGIESHKEM